MDAFCISELHRAVRPSGACQCAISLMDSAIATLLRGSGFMETLAIWFVCPFNLIAGMLSARVRGLISSAAQRGRAAAEI